MRYKIWGNGHGGPTARGANREVDLESVVIGTDAPVATPARTRPRRRLRWLGLVGAVGIAVSAAIINDRTNLHFLHIASHLTPANGAMHRFVHAVEGRYGTLPGSEQGGHLAALEQLWHLAYREASTLAFADAFHTIMLAFVIATLLVLLMRRVAPATPAAATSAH